MAVCLEFPHDYDYGCDADDLKLPLDEFQINDLGFEESEFNCRKEQSIQGDVAKIAASRSRSISGNWQLEDIGDINDMNILVDTKRDMRNGDCMWSAFGTANTCHSGSNNNNSSNNNCSSSSNNNCCNSNSNSAASSYNESRAVPPSIVMLIKPEMCDDDDQEEELEEEDDDSEEEEENKAERCNSINNINNINKLTTFATSDRITIMHNKNRTMATMQQRFSKINTHKYSSNNVEQHIPPGASLLRKSNPPLAASAGLKSSGSMVRRTPKFEEASCPSTMMAAPPVFRHTVDLAACLMGSNNISLTTGSIGSGSNCDVSNHHIIDHISRELQNEKSRFDSLPTNYQPQITDVLDYINQQVSADAAAASSPLKTTTTAATTTTTAATTTMSPPATNSDCDSDDGDCSMVDSSCGSSSYMRHISDHSYTRSEMETNLETPSDSDEEIDVVSLNDKKLPTNPSDRDRRALQTKVAHKISTIPPPRRNRFELPYTPASSSPVKSEANSRFPSPSSTPYQSSGAAVATVYSPLLLRNSNSNSSSSSSSSSSAGSDCATPASTLLWGGDNINTNGGGSNKSSRKRYQDTCRSSAFSKQLQASKKSRAKLNHSVLPAAAALHSQLKQQPTLGANSSSSSSLSCTSSSSSNSANSSSNSNSNSVNFSIMKRQFSMDEADTIEKRNLHNDMERQRRIGLKNLFEALKKQIPNIRDKERAPKVNILREAAKLCEQLTNEERELSLKRQLLKAKQKQRQEMIARLRLSANAAE